MIVVDPFQLKLFYHIPLYSILLIQLRHLPWEVQTAIQKCHYLRLQEKYTFVIVSLTFCPDLRYLRESVLKVFEYNISKTVVHNYLY